LIPVLRRCTQRLAGQTTVEYQLHQPLPGQLSVLTHPSDRAGPLCLPQSGPQSVLIGDQPDGRGAQIFDLAGTEPVGVQRC
jgi:hypothetical protein